MTVFHIHASMLTAKIPIDVDNPDGWLCVLFYWQTLILSPKSKIISKVDNWVFINIKISNHPPTPNNTPSKVSKKQYTAIHPKQNVLVYVRRFWNVFGNRPRPIIDLPQLVLGVNNFHFICFLQLLILGTFFLLFWALMGYFWVLCGGQK